MNPVTQAEEARTSSEETFATSESSEHVSDSHKAKSSTALEKYAQDCDQIFVIDDERAACANALSIITYLGSARFPNALRQCFVPQPICFSTRHCCDGRTLYEH